MIVNTIDKIEIEYNYMLTQTAQLVVRIYYNGDSKFEKSILEEGVNSQFLQLMYALYVIFDKTNLLDVFYEIVDRMHCTISKENYSLFTIQLTTKLVNSIIPIYECDDFKNLEANLDLDWDNIDVVALKNYTIIHNYPD